MSIRTRLALAFLILAGAGFTMLIRWTLNDIRPRYLATMEESLVDTATLLASLVETEMRAEDLNTEPLRLAFENARRKQLSARIYEVTKGSINTRVYVTDGRGIVVFDSDAGRDEGADYSRWNDVMRTLRGEYGARASRTDPDDWTTEVLYVAAPIMQADRIVGVLTVAKPSDSVAQFVATAGTKFSVAGAIAAMAVIALGVITTIWITQPVEALTRYAQAVRDGKRVPPPRLGRNEIGALGEAFEEMRQALEGKRYVEEYVQVLTHELKSPLSAIRGAAELLEEDMPVEQRRHFLANLRAETARIQDLVDRMLQLSALENRNELRDVEDVDVVELIGDVLEGLETALAAKRLRVDRAVDATHLLRGERFLLRQAVTNLLQNAIDFSEIDGTIGVKAGVDDGGAIIAIADDGPGVPEYALPRIFDRFYSLRRAGTGRKSSGLGLAFVKEVAELHGGRITLENRPERGALATLSLPRTPARRE